MNTDSNQSPDSCREAYEKAERLFQEGLTEARSPNGAIGVTNAIELFRESITLDPTGHRHVQGHLAWLYYSNKQYLAAVKLYREILDREPGNPDALFYCGMSLVQAKRRREAIPYLLRAARAKIPSQEGWNALWLAIYNLLPLQAQITQAYLICVWWFSATILGVFNLCRGNFRFAVSAYMRWCLRKNPELLKQLAYIRARELEFAYTLLEVPIDGVVVDVGTGTSAFTPFAATRGIRVIGLDPDRCIEELRTSIPDLAAGELDERLLLMRADGLRLPFPDESLRYIVCISTIEHIPGDGDRELVKELARVLTPGGRIVLTTEGANQTNESWRSQPFRVGLEYAEGDRDFPTCNEDSSSIGFYRFYDPCDLVERLGSAPGLVCVEAGYLIDRSGWRKHFPDEPLTFWSKLASPWKSLIGYLSLRQTPLPVPPDTDLTGSVGYLIFEKPIIE